MAALDDALHGNLGKAGEDRIFEMEHTYDPLPVILTGKKSLRWTVLLDNIKLLAVKIIKKARFLVIYYS